MFVRDGGALGAMTVAVWAFATGRIVPRWIYDDVAHQRDKALTIGEAMASAYERQRNGPAV